MLGKTVRFRIPSDVYFMIVEKIKRNRVHGVYFINESLCRIFLKGVEVLGSEGIDRIILDIKAEKDRRWKERKAKAGGTPNVWW